MQNTSKLVSTLLKFSESCCHGVNHLSESVVIGLLRVQKKSHLLIIESLKFASSFLS